MRRHYRNQHCPGEREVRPGKQAILHNFKFLKQAILRNFKLNSCPILNWVNFKFDTLRRKKKHKINFCSIFYVTQFIKNGYFNM